MGDEGQQTVTIFCWLLGEEWYLFSTFGPLVCEEQQAAAVQCPGSGPDLHQCLWSRSLDGINPKMHVVWFRGNWSTVFCAQWLIRTVRNFRANFNFVNNQLFSVTGAEPQAAWWWIITITTLKRPAKQCVSQIYVALFSQVPLGRTQSTRGRKRKDFEWPAWEKGARIRLIKLQVGL